MIRIKATKQQQCTSDIDKMVNICYSIAVQHDPTTRIGSKLLDIAENGCFGCLFDKLPKNYKQFNKKSGDYKNKQTQQQRQMYQDQLSSVLETSLVRSRSTFHPMRAFGHSSHDLNDSFNDISLDINRNRTHNAKQRLQRAHSVPVHFNHSFTPNDPNDDDVKEEEIGNKQEELLCYAKSNDSNCSSDKENAAKNSKISGNKRKRDAVAAKEDNDGENCDNEPDKPSPSK